MEEALEAALEAVGATGTDGLAPVLLAGVPSRDTDLIGGACEGLAFFSAEGTGGAVEGVPSCSVPALHPRSRRLPGQSTVSVVEEVREVLEERVRTTNQSSCIYI